MCKWIALSLLLFTSCIVANTKHQLQKDEQPQRAEAMIQFQQSYDSPYTKPRGQVSCILNDPFETMSRLTSISKSAQWNQIQL